MIGDGGDFVSYAGKLVDSYEPGCFLDPGPFGCLGMGPGYALAAGVAHPDRQLVLLLGDGAIGFTLGDLDTLVRFGIDVVMIVGNNGIWGLEKHPMELFFGYAVVAELRPGTRYDLVLEALGGHGELVEEPDRARPGARPCVRDEGAVARERAHRPRRRLPAVQQPRPDRSAARQRRPIAQTCQSPSSCWSPTATSNVAAVALDRPLDGGVDDVAVEVVVGRSSSTLSKS